MWGTPERDGGILNGIIQEEYGRGKARGIPKGIIQEEYSPRQWERGIHRAGFPQKKICLRPHPASYSLLSFAFCAHGQPAPTRTHAPFLNKQTSQVVSLPRPSGVVSPHLAGSVFVKNREHEICARRRSPQRRPCQTGDGGPQCICLSHVSARPSTLAGVLPDGPPI